MTAKEVSSESGPINSSYVVLFHVSVALTAPFIITAFPSELRSDALMVALVFPIAVFWFNYLIKQFVDTSLVLRLVLGVAFITAALSFLNAMYGNLFEDFVPIIYTRVPFFATLLAGISGFPGLIYAGTILTYGAYIYIFCVMLASLFERLYEKYGKRLLPQKVRHGLTKLDASIDVSAVRASDRFFVLHQSTGLIICLGLIFIYSLLYVLLLIK